MPIQSPRWRTVLDTIATLALTLAAAMIVYSYWPASRQGRGPQVTIPSEPIQIVGSAVVGHPKAKVALIEFSEFQCPFCRRHFEQTAPEIKRRYVETGEVAVVFKHLPLEAIHPFARSAAEGAVCAHEQGRFVQMHDRLFVNQGQLNLDSATQYAKELGLDLGKFGVCLADSGRGRVSEDLALAERLGVSSTPTFFVGTFEGDGKVRVKFRIDGARALSEFESAFAKLRTVASSR